MKRIIMSIVFSLVVVLILWFVAAQAFPPPLKMQSVNCRVPYSLEYCQYHPLDATWRSSDYMQASTDSTAKLQPAAGL